MLVFSAPRYCDATENKGAYINIRPDLKLNFHKFNAVPHPDIKPMVGSPQHLYRVPISNRILGIRTELSHVTNVISTYFDGSRQIFFDKSWPPNEHGKVDREDFISIYGSWHKVYEVEAVIVIREFPALAASRNLLVPY